MYIFREGKFKFLVMTETKLKGNGEVSWCGVNSIIADVQKKERAREGVVILLNDVWHSAVIDFRGIKVCVVVGYGPNEDRKRRL